MLDAEAQQHPCALGDEALAAFVGRVVTVRHPSTPSARRACPPFMLPPGTTSGTHGGGGRAAPPPQLAQIADGLCAAASEARSLLAHATAALPPREREVLRLYYEESRTLREIGTAMSVSESRVSHLHSQAISRLRALLVD